VSSAYEYLISMDNNAIFVNSDNVWLKAVSLKGSMFVWRLLLNRSLTKDNLIRRRVIHNKDLLCIGGCDIAKDRNHLSSNVMFLASYVFSHKLARF